MKTDLTKELEEKMIEHLNPRKDTRVYLAQEVTFDYGKAHPFRVDIMQFKPVNNTISGLEHGDFYCYEVKSSVKDFKSKNGHNFYGDYNYYIMPEEVYEVVKKEIDWNIGVYCYLNGRIYCKKKAKRKSRQKSVTEMLFCMFRSANRSLMEKL